MTVTKIARRVRRPSSAITSLLPIDSSAVTLAVVASPAAFSPSLASKAS